MDGKKFAAIFPGQGCQYPGMCRELISGDEKTARIFKTAGELLGYDLADVIENGGMKLLTQSENAQPTVVAASYAYFMYMRRSGFPESSVMIGHSLGELSAFAAAGGISFEDAIILARKRGGIMDEAVRMKYGRAGIVLDINGQQLEEAVNLASENEPLYITGYNSPGQFTVAGADKALRRLNREVNERGGQYIPFAMVPMKADAPFHSPLMSPLKRQIERELEEICFRDLQAPVYSTVTGKIIESAADIKDALTKQLVSPVLWTQALERAQIEFDLDFFVDMGPGTISKGLVAENPALKKCFCCDGGEELPLPGTA